MSLIRANRLAELQLLLSAEELRPLKGLVLMVGWDHCSGVDQARELLNALYEPHVSQSN